MPLFLGYLVRAIRWWPYYSAIHKQHGNVCGHHCGSVYEKGTYCGHDRLVWSTIGAALWPLVVGFYVWSGAIVSVVWLIRRIKPVPLPAEPFRDQYMIDAIEWVEREIPYD